MISTFLGIEIARRGLQGNRNAMDVTAHNLANAGTKGYTRQNPIFVATDPYTIPNRNQRLIPGQIGTGTEVAQIRRIRDSLLDIQMRSALGEAGFWEERHGILQQVEAVFPEPSDIGMLGLIGKFFNAWQELNNSPQDPGVKAAVREVGEELATTIRQTSKQLQEIKQNTEESIGLKITEANRIAAELGVLNKAIGKIVAAGNQPNDLLDRRDLLLDQLAVLGLVEAKEDAQGKVDVYFYGQQLVEVTGAVNTFDGVTNGESGSLAGAESALERVEQYISDIDLLADSVRDQVNSLHNVSPANVNFFNPGSAGAANFEVSDEIKNDLNAVSGEQALVIAQLRYQLTMPPGNPSTTFEGFYRSLAAGIGADTEGAEYQVAGSKAVTGQLENLRQSVAGVSLDEELTRLTQFQYAYQASARVVAVMDDILDTLINRLR